VNKQSERVDVLADIVIQLANLFSLTTNRQALLHGMPLQNGQLAAENLDQAAVRAGLKLSRWNQPVTMLTNSCCPLLVIEKTSGKAFIIESINHNEKKKLLATVTTREGQTDDTSLADVFKASGKGADKDAGHEIFIARPARTTDSRTDEIPVEKPPHWFWSALKINSGIYGHIILATLVINLLALAIPLVTMNIYDRVVANAAFTTLWSLALGAGLAAVFDLILRTTRAIMIDRASARSDVMLANRIFARLLGARLKGRQSSVGVQANTLREFESLREFFNSATIAALGDLPFLALFLLVISIVSGPLVMVTAIAIPVVLLVGYLTQRKLNQIVAQGFMEAAQKNAVVVESLAGLETIKSIAAESWAASHWERSVASHLRHSLKSRLLMSLSGHLVAFATGVTTIALLVYGVYLVTAGTITPGAMFAATILNGRCMGPLGQLAGLLTRLHQARMAFTAIRQIVDLPQERKEGSTYLRKDKFDGAISFDQVKFAYEEEAPDALRDITLSIKPHERVGIIGGVGSGKTTLMKLALGLHKADDGRILIDGLPVDQIDPANLRSSIGSLLQDTTLFHGDIRSNITLNAPDASDEQLLRALDTSGALDWIRTLPQGLDSLIGERGAGLSGGQKQTLCLARALVRDPDILLLDEPTSNMDGVTEKAFISRLAKRLVGKTLVLITHKPSLLVLVNRLIVMERGKVLLDGPKNKVLEELKKITAERLAEQQANVKVAQQRANQAGEATTSKSGEKAA
jgi:ATP-binding cassette subfamily C protein LapB